MISKLSFTSGILGFYERSFMGVEEEHSGKVCCCSYFRKAPNAGVSVNIFVISSRATIQYAQSNTKDDSPVASF